MGPPAIGIGLGYIVPRGPCLDMSGKDHPEFWMFDAVTSIVGRGEGSRCSIGSIWEVVQ
jgi:hypothetical protein